MEEKAIDEMQLVLFSIDGEKFGIEIDLVLEIIKQENITRLPNVEHFVKGVINLRGKIVVVLDTATKLGLPAMIKNPSSRILIIKTGDEVIGLYADACEDVINVNIDKVKSTPKIISSKLNSEFIRGVVTLDKEMIILLDVDKFLSGQDFSLNKKF